MDFQRIIITVFNALKNSKNVRDLHNVFQHGEVPGSPVSPSEPQLYRNPSRTEILRGISSHSVFPHPYPPPHA